MTTSRRTSPTREVGPVADRLHSAAIHLLRRLRVEDEALGISAPRLPSVGPRVRGAAKDRRARADRAGRASDDDPARRRPGPRRPRGPRARSGRRARGAGPRDAEGRPTLKRGRERRVETPAPRSRPSPPPSSAPWARASRCSSGSRATANATASQDAAEPDALPRGARPIVDRVPVHEQQVGAFPRFDPADVVQPERLGAGRRGAKGLERPHPPVDHVQELRGACRAG